jgi:predicted nucleotidyltransferase
VGSNPRIALHRLRDAAESWELDELRERHSVRVLTAFGSAVRDDSAQSRDLDLAVSFRYGQSQRPSR